MFWDELIGILRKAAMTRMSDEDSIDLFALAGTVAFLAPTLTDRVRGALERRSKTSSRLLNAVNDLSMIPAFFALQGLALFYPMVECFPPLRRRWLVEKSEEYEDRGPAIEWLCEWLRANPQISRDSAPDGPMDTPGLESSSRLNRRSWGTSARKDQAASRRRMYGS